MGNMHWINSLPNCLEDIAEKKKTFSISATLLMSREYTIKFIFYMFQYILFEAKNNGIEVKMNFKCALPGLNNKCPLSHML